MTWNSDVLVNPYQEAVEDLIIPSVTLPNYGKGLTNEDIVTICNDLNSTTAYLIDFVEGTVDEETAFDAVEQYTSAHGTDMDAFLDTAIENLEGFVTCPQKYL